MKRLLLAIGALLLFAAAPARAQAAHSITLTWTASAPCSGSTNCNPVSYLVMRGTSSGNETTLATIPATSLTYVDTTGVGGTTYYYIVEATNTAGPSKASNEVNGLWPVSTITVTIPNAPGTLSISVN